MPSEVVAGLIFVVFLSLLIVGATSTLVRQIRYYRHHEKPPVLLARDRDLLLGLAIPFVVIGAVRAFGLTDLVAPHGEARTWYLLVTGLPPIYALARYCYYELFVIERPRR